MSGAGERFAFSAPPWWPSLLGDRLGALGEAPGGSRKVPGPGRPALEDYEVSFVAIDQGGNPPPGGWQIRRRFYRQVVSLSHARRAGLPREHHRSFGNVRFVS
jgi:hypothetical protein